MHSLSRLDKLIYIQAVIFGILFAIWSLPETILIRNLCLMIGSLIGIYQIYYYYDFLWSKKAISVWLILTLFIWMTIHLLFLSNGFELQYAEYTSIWKRSFLGFLYAVGLGLGLANASTKAHKVTWPIFYAGLLAPTLIYIFKYLMINGGQWIGISIPEYFQLYQWGSSKYYIAKTAYVGFCIPVAAVALGQLYYQVRDQLSLTWLSLIYLFTLILVLFIFLNENIKNGIVYLFLLILIFSVLVSIKCFKSMPLRTISLILIIGLTLGISLVSHIQNNQSWKTFFSDAKIAIQTEKLENWKCGVQLGFPKNELGIEIPVTNYERIAWSIEATKLVAKYPLGYGLVERSFRYRGKLLWPNSCLTQSHSGWLDLALGIGIPGMVLVFGALFFSLKNLIQFPYQKSIYLRVWGSMLTWALLSFLLIWCTTEISQKIFLDELIFFLSIGGGFVAGLFKANSNSEK